MISLKNGMRFRDVLLARKYSAKHLLLCILASNLLFFCLLPAESSNPPQLKLPNNYVIIRIQAQLNTVFEMGKEVTLISRKDDWQTNAILLKELSQADLFQSDGAPSFEIAVNGNETHRIIQGQMAIYPKFNYGVKREKTMPTRDASF